MAYYIKNTNTEEIEQFSQIPLQYYGAEKETFINENGITCQRAKLKDEYIILTENDSEVQEKILLPEIKKQEIALIEDVKKKELEKNHQSAEAEALKMVNGVLQYDLDENGEKIKKQFTFRRDQESINLIFSVLSSLDPDCYADYSCQETGEFFRINKYVASIINCHIFIIRNQLLNVLNSKITEINSVNLSENQTFEKAIEKIKSIISS
jgi:hypothetical protein